MVWNITKDAITERMAVVTDDAWSVPGTAMQPPPEKGLPNPLSEAMDSGRLDVKDAEAGMLREFWEKYDVTPIESYQHSLEE